MRLSGFAPCLPANPSLPLPPHLLCSYLSWGNNHLPACPDRLWSLKLPEGEGKSLPADGWDEERLVHAKYGEERASNSIPSSAR